MRVSVPSPVAVAAIVVALLLAGCLVSGTKVFEYDVVRTGNMGRPIDVVATPVEAILVDLEANDTFEAHRSDIQQIDRLGFAATVDNRAGAATDLSVHFDTRGDTDPLDLTSATVLLEDLRLPAGEIVQISYDETEKTLRNFDAFRRAVTSGEFRLVLSTGSGAGVSVTDLVLVVTFTVGL